MTVGDLIRVLGDACEDADVSIDDVEVHIALQQWHPMEYEVDEGPDITIVEVQNDEYERFDKVIYIPTTEHNNYLPRVAAVALGWKEDR